MSEALREHGLEVDEFLREADGFIAALEGRSDGDYDVDGFVGRIGAFVEELRQCDHLLKQAEAVRLVEQLPRTPDMLDAIAKEFGELGSERALRMAEEVRAEAEAVRARLAEGVIPVSELEGLSLSISAEAAEANRRVVYRCVALARFLETRPAEWWAARTDAERAQTETFLESWRREREEVLGQLPLADRRRLEAGRMEEFDAPEIWQPG